MTIVKARTDESFRVWFEWRKDAEKDWTDKQYLAYQLVLCSPSFEVYLLFVYERDDGWHISQGRYVDSHSQMAWYYDPKTGTPDITSDACGNKGVFPNHNAAISATNEALRITDFIERQDK